PRARDGEGAGCGARLGRCRRGGRDGHGRKIVTDDRDRGTAGGSHDVGGRSAERDDDSLIRLGQRVVDRRHDDGGGGAAGEQRHRAAQALVVGVRRRGARHGIEHRERGRRGPRAGHGEGAGGGAGLAGGGRGGHDGHRGAIVAGDRHGGRAGRPDEIRGIGAERDDDGLVVDRHHGDRGRGTAGEDGHGAGQGLVVAARGGRARHGIAHRQRRGRRPRARHGEGAAAGLGRRRGGGDDGHAREIVADDRDRGGGGSADEVGGVGAERDHDRLVRLGDLIVEWRHGERGRGAAGGQGHAARQALVVTPRRRGARHGVEHGERSRRRARARHGEHAGGGADLAGRRGGGGDGHRRRIVAHDRDRGRA